MACQFAFNLQAYDLTSEHAVLLLSPSVSYRKGVGL